MPNTPGTNHDQDAAAEVERAAFPLSHLKAEHRPPTHGAAAKFYADKFHEASAELELLRADRNNLRYHATKENERRKELVTELELVHEALHSAARLIGTILIELK